MGDVIHALPVASAIHQAWPDTRITWIIDPRWAPLLEDNPSLSATHEFPRSEFRGPLGILRFFTWCRSLRDISADAALDLQCLLRSGLMARFSAARRVWGLSDAREGAGFFYTDRVSVSDNEHAVQRYLRALPAMGIPMPEQPDWTLPRGREPKTIPKNSPFVVIHPFARGAGKSLNKECLDAFLKTFRKHSNLPCVLVGAGTYNSEIHADVLNLLHRTTLAELITILRQATFVVSVDSGPMHLAAALGTPLLSVHTWSDPRRVGPYEESAWIWQGGQIRRQNLNLTPRPQKTFSPEDACETAKFVALEILRLIQT